MDTAIVIASVGLAVISVGSLVYTIRVFSLDKQIAKRIRNFFKKRK